VARLQGRTLYWAMGGALVAAVVLIGISGIPRFKDGHGLAGVIGGIGWFGGCLMVLLFLILAGRAVYLAVRRRSAPASA
jgi:hypothetical protein